MSTARLRIPRRPSRVKTYDFSPGRLERLTLTVWRIPRSDGVIRARLTGQAYVACGAGNEHYPQVDIDLVTHPSNPGTNAEDAAAAIAGDPEAALELAERLEEWALEDWFDPCEAEGLDEEED